MKTPAPHSPLTAAQLDALNRFAEIMESLCAVVVARLAPRSFWGRMFGGVSRLFLTRICDEMRGISDRFRALALAAINGAAISQTGSDTPLFAPVPGRDCPGCDKLGLGDAGGAPPKRAARSDAEEATLHVGAVRPAREGAGETPGPGLPHALAAGDETMAADGAGETMTADAADATALSFAADGWTTPPAWQRGAADVGRVAGGAICAPGGARYRLVHFVAIS